MKCPFRLNIEYEYGDLDNKGIIAVIEQREVFPDCYENDCPCWKYDHPDGYHCLKADAFEGIDEE